MMELLHLIAWPAFWLSVSISTATIAGNVWKICSRSHSDR